MSKNPTEPVLALQAVSKRFGGVQALAGIDLDLHAGKITALVGDNGAGKSTLTKVISGIYSPDGGTITRAGKLMRFTGPKDATKAGIQTVYQDLALCDNLDTVNNLFLGREEGGGWRGLFRLSQEEMEARAVSTLESLGVKIPDFRAPISQLSGGQRQGIAIARSILTLPQIVLLDEPTAALGVTQREQVRNLLERLRDQGLALMVISHDMNDVQYLADTVEVLRLGRKVATFHKGEYTASDVVHAITGASDGSKTAA